MSSKFSVTVYRNNVFTKDGQREVFRARAWDAVTAEDGSVSFKLKMSAAMSLPVGFGDQFNWQPIVDKDGVVTGHKVKMMIYGSISTDKGGNLWINPFAAVPQGDGKWKVVDRGTPDAKPMVFELAPWPINAEKTTSVESTIVAEDAHPF